MSDQIAEITAGSWTEAIDLLYYGSWDAEIRRHRSPYVFRGMSDSKAHLSTSLMRLGSGGDLRRLEAHMLRNFRKYGHSVGVEGDTLWTWLARAQHFGLQTRLLDWSYSPLVGLHFATVRLDQHHLDGAVWMVDHRKTLERIPPPLRKVAEREGSNVFTMDMLAEVAPSLEEFDNLADNPFVAFVEPPSLDARIANQFALFSVMSSPASLLDEWLKAHPYLARKIVIPAACKLEFRDKLDQAGISERMLFPGLDGLARWLSRYYMPRNQS